MTRRLRPLALSTCWLTCLALIAPACSGEVTEEDLDKWRHNDKGLARISEVVASPEQPMATRVRALEVVVEKNNPKKIRGMLDELDADARAEVVAGLSQELLAHIESKDEFQLNAKDALMVMHRYMTAEGWTEVQIAIAKWAFDGVTWEAPTEVVKKKIETRVTTGQIYDLGEHGWEGAAIILSRGLAVSKMLDILTGSKDPRATKLLLRAMAAMHQEIGVAIHHLTSLADTNSGTAAGYLLEIYIDEKKQYEEDIRTAAFNTAIAMLEKPEFDKGDGSVVDSLVKVMAAKNGGDRWFGAVNIVLVDGISRLGAILDAFKDDGVYDANAEPSPLKFTQDLCLDILDQGKAAEAAAEFTARAKSGNRIQAAISIACLKAFGDPSAKDAIKARSVVAKAGPTSLADFLGEGYTLEGLASNALEGIALMKKADAEAASSNLDKIELRNKKLIIFFELKAVGAEYAKLVTERFADFRAEYVKDPAAFKK